MKRIKEIREENHKTQAEISKMLGIKYQAYQRYETGESPLPLKYAIKLADYYQVSLDYLVGRI